MDSNRGLTLGLGILMGVGLVCGVAAANMPSDVPACPTEDVTGCSGVNLDTPDPGPEPEPVYGHEFRMVGPLCDAGKAITREEQRTWSTPYSLVDGEWVILGDKEYTNWHLIDETVQDSAECAPKPLPTVPPKTDQPKPKPTMKPVTEAPSQQKLDWDEGTLECGINAKPAIDQDAHGNWWAYCEPGLIGG